MFSAHTTQTPLRCSSERCFRSDGVVVFCAPDGLHGRGAARRQSTLCVWLASNVRVAA